MKKTIFKGAATALVTPFKNGAVDTAAFGNIIEEQIVSGIDALVICGTSGEASTLDDNEHIGAIEFAVKTVNGRVPVIAGTGSNDTRHGLNLSKRAESVGADALLVCTPYYNKTSQNGLKTMYTLFADSVDIPIIMYNVPSRTGLNIEPQTYAYLADHPNICAIKEANGNFSKIAETFALVGDKLDIYSGNDDQTVPILSLGGKGVISVLSNVLPAETSKMCRLYFEGDVSQSAAMQLKYVPLISALFSDVNPIPVKEAMYMLGKCTPELRLPLVRMSAEKAASLRAELVKAGCSVKN